MPRDPKDIAKNKSRRGKNEGSIYKRKDGRWCAQAVLGYDESGKPIRKYIYGKSRQEVAKQLTESTYTVYKHGYSSYMPDANAVFYEELYDWFVTYKMPNIADSTIEKNLNFLKNHVKPWFKAAKTLNLSTDSFQRFFNSIAKKLCLQSLKHLKQLLNQFFKYAIKRGIVRENYIEDVKIKTIERSEKIDNSKALSVDLRKQVLAGINGNEILKPILITLIFTGIRPGELIGLCWSDIDFNNQTISIRRSTGRKIDFDDSGNALSRSTVLTKTKTVLSKRTFKAPNIVISAISEWLIRQQEIEEAKGLTLTKPDCFVFCTKSGTMRAYLGLRSLLKRFIEKYELSDNKINLYTFRHTFATILLEKRENMKIVSSLMGHAKVGTTLDIYSHVLPNVYEETANKLDDAYDNLI